MQNLALEQWTRDLPVRAMRGDILDRNGVTLASSKTSYDIFVRPRMIKDEADAAKKIAAILDLDEKKLYEKLKKKTTSEFTLKLSVDEDTAKRLLALDINGVYYSISSSRVYAYGALASQVIGFTSIDGVGQSGIELLYDDVLSGENGQILTQTDLLGIEIEDSVTYIKNGVDGLDVKLTLSYEIQSIAENALKRAMIAYTPKSASAVVMDVNSGEILAMASLPSLDLNDLPRDDLISLFSLSRNRLITDIYEPGSTFKVLTASMNLEEYKNGNPKAFSPEHVFSSAGIRVVDGQTIKCWTKHTNGKHSAQHLKEALQNSCNPIFVDIATNLGKDTVYKYLSAFGYGKQTGIDFVGEESGMLLSKESAKTCDVARIGFGQTIAVTPLQLLNATAAAINGGKLLKPRLIKSIGQGGRTLYTSETKVISRPISEETSAIMREYLHSVVENGGGKNAKVEGVSVGGKTGTAQKYVNGAISHGKYVSSFVGFFPVESPKYIMLVLVDEPVGGYYGSTVAAPIAKEIIEGIVSLS